MPNATCFDPLLLKDYLLGKLTDEDSDIVAAHLEACLTCEATVSELDRASDTLTNGLRLPLATSSSESQAVAKLQLALAKLPTSEAPSGSSESSASEMISTVLRDYRLLEPLGFGGMGTVYKAVHTRLDRLVAVKLLPSRRLGDEQAVSRFQREMRVIGQLSHPAIVQATDAGEVDGTHFLVMEYVDGFDLNHVAKTCGLLSVADACEIVRQAALGLEYAHQQGIVHRDIKPSNLMLSRGEGQGTRDERNDRPSSPCSPFVSGSSPLIKILDLGLALLSGEQAPVDELTTVGQLMGTLDYMAPEQLEDSHQVGPQADVYALSATLHRLLTGVAPFAKEDRKTPLQKLRALATQIVPPIRERRADLPVALAEIIDRSLRRDPAERFASMFEFAAAIVPWCDGHDLNKLAQRAAAAKPIIPQASMTASLVRNPKPERGRTIHESPSSTPNDALASVSSDMAQGSINTAIKEIATSKPPRRRLWTSVVSAIVGLVALGLIFLETGKGQIVIESAENVEVRIKRSGKVVEQFEVATGSKSTRVAAGEYEIELVGASDKLQIEQNRVSLLRGGQVVVKISDVQKPGDAITKPTNDPNDTGIGIARPGKTDAPIPAKPLEVVDRAAKGMETFEALNPDIAEERKVRVVLQKKIDTNLQDVPLTDVVGFYSEQSGVEFLVDVQALSEAGIATDQSVSQSLKGTATSVSLDFLLRPLQLDWEVDGGQVMITTIEKASTRLVNRTYPVGKLLPGIKRAVERERLEPPKVHPNSGGGGGFFSVGVACVAPSLLNQFGGGGGGQVGQQANLPSEAGHLQFLLEEIVSHPWQSSDGEGGSLEMLHNVLLVRQTPRAHADIEALLRTIEGAFLKPLTAAAEVRPAGYPIEEDARIRQQLAKTLEGCEFQDTPLADAVGFLQDKLDVQVLLMKHRLNEEAIAIDSPITLTLKNATGELLLKRMLQPLNLAWNIEQGVLVITTAAHHAEQMVTKVYDVRELLARGLHPDRLVGGLQSTTQGPWRNRDGEGGTTTVFADTLMVVRQTEANHVQVEKFLASLWLQMSDEPLKPFQVESTKPTAPANAYSSGLGGAATAKPNSNKLKPGTAPASEPKSAQPVITNSGLYEGKNFDTWLAVLNTERSPTRLSDAFEALRLLAKPEQAKLLAERALQVFRQVDGEAQVGTGNERRPMWSVASDLFNSIPADVLAAAAAAELQQGNTRSRRVVLLFLVRGTPEWWGTHQFQAAVFQTCTDSDVVIREQSVLWLSSMMDRLATPDFPERAKPRLRNALSDKVGTVAFAAARGLIESEQDKVAVSELLTRLLTQSENVTLSTEALRLIAIMGANASTTVTAIIPKLLEESSPEVERAARSGLGQSGSLFGNFRRGGSSGRSFSQRELAILALARMGKSAESALPVIEKELSLPSHKIRYSNSLDVLANFAEHLVAAKVRIKGFAIPDAEHFAKNGKATIGELTLLEAIYKSLRSENELLRQHYGDQHAKVRELDAQMKTLRDNYDRAKNGTLNGEQRLPDFDLDEAKPAE